MEGGGWRGGLSHRGRIVKFTCQCCSYDRVTAISEPSCVDCCDNNTIVGAWDEVRQGDHLPTH